MIQNPIAHPVKRSLRDSLAFKLFAIGFLVLVLLIPLGMVRSLVAERQARRDQTGAEVAATWGHPQTLAGPILTIPYRLHGMKDGKPVTWVSFADFLPETLNVEGRIVPEKRTRGIFEAVVYRAELRWTGAFERPRFEAWRVEPGDVIWEDALLTIGVPDMRGIDTAVKLDWGGREIQLAPGNGGADLWSSGLRSPVAGLAGLKEGERASFAFDLGINGSRALCFLPFGKQTTVALKSTWPDPSFTGAFLPVSRRVGGTGFDARWSVSWFGRSYPQQWRKEDENGGQTLHEGVPVSAFSREVDASAFGVELFLPVDAYQKTERSVKYGVLFLLLTFVTFFLYEVFNPFQLHPVQYLLVGAALCLFYLLLLSISEHALFAFAYLVASASTILLIGGYSAAILRGRLRALAMTGVLGFLYGYLYVLLQLEDYALLLGAIGLFLILALIMFVTRKVDWYGPRKGRSPEVPVPAGI